MKHPLWDVRGCTASRDGVRGFNDFDRRAGDPAFKTVCDRLPTRDGDLASQPTLSRFENALSRADLFRSRRGRRAAMPASPSYSPGS